VVNRAEKRKQKKLAASKTRLGQPKALSPQQLADLQSTFNEALNAYTLGDLQAAQKRFQHILKIVPNHPISLHFLGLIALQANQTTAGIDLIRKALIADPNYDEARINLGNALQEMEFFDDAVKQYQDVIKRLPQSAEAHLGLGTTFQKQGRIKDALSSFQTVLKISPNLAEAHNNIGPVFEALGEVEQAIEHYNIALRLNPQDVEVLRNLGVACQNIGLLKEAEEHLCKALAIDPDFAEAHSSLGLVFLKNERLDKAVESFQRAISIKPDYKPALINLGNVQITQTLFDLAINSFEQVLTIDPKYADAFIGMSMALEKSGRLKEAEENSLKALDISSDSAEAHLALGNVRQTQMRMEEALVCYDRALELKPDFAEVYCSKGLVCQDLARLDAADENFRAALKLDPSLKMAQNNLFLLQLLRGDFKNGFADTTSRFAISRENNKTMFHKPRWAGEKLDGKCLALISEQGIGDEIMFSTMFADLNTNKTKLIVECDKRLLPIYERSFKDVTFVEKSRPPSELLNGDDVDYQIEIGSLGHYLRNDLNDFPKPSAFFKARPKHVNELRQRYLKQSKGRPIIGISWSSESYGLKTKKSIDLEKWMPILSSPTHSFLNLQYGDVDEDLSLIKEQHGVEIFKDTDIDPLKDMEGFVDQVAAVDMVISISNATVHVAGALGKKTWLLLPLVSPIWGWQMDRSDSLWYPNIKMFRQPTFGDWTTVIDTVAQDLRATVL